MMHAAAAMAAHNTKIRCNIWKLAGHDAFSVTRFPYTKLISLKLRSSHGRAGADQPRSAALLRLEQPVLSSIKWA